MSHAGLRVFGEFGYAVEPEIVRVQLWVYAFEDAPESHVGDWEHFAVGLCSLPMLHNQVDIRQL